MHFVWIFDIFYFRDFFLFFFFLVYFFGGLPFTFSYSWGFPIFFLSSIVNVFKIPFLSMLFIYINISRDIMYISNQSLHEPDLNRLNSR